MKFLRSLPSWVGHAFRIGLGVLVIYLLIRTGALKPVLLAQAMRQHPFQYAVAFLLYAVVLESLAYLRWLWLLRVARVSISAWEVLRLHLMGLFFSGFLPGGTGGDLVKGYYLLRGRSKADGAAALGTIVVDRFTGMFGLILLGATTSFLNIDIWRSSQLLVTQTFFIQGLAVGAVMLVGVFLAKGKPKGKINPGSIQPARGFIREFLTDVAAFRNAPRVVLGAIGISLLVHVCLVAIYALCSQTLDVSLPFIRQAFVVPSLTLLNGIPISPSGLGVGEAGGKFLYEAVGASRGSEIVALVHTVVLSTALLCAPVYFFSKWNEKKPAEPD